MHTPLTQQSRNRLTMLLSKHSAGTYQETSSHTTRQGTLSQSSQLAEPLWTDPRLKSWISVPQLISIIKKKSTGMEWMVEHSSKILACKDKASTTTKPPLIWDQLGLSLVELATCEIYILTRTVHKTHFDLTFDPFFLKKKKKTTKKNQLCENVTSVIIPPPPNSTSKHP